MNPTMPRGSEEFPGSVEGTVKFDEITCCALERAFEQNPKVVQRLEDITDNDEQMKLFKEILSSTDEIKFVPSEEMKTVYSQIAKRELERIDAEDEDDGDLVCGHSIADHQQALKSVVEKMEPAVN